ncbi:DUF1000-domain-containing protein [Hysterangium stoloniferum]|nr:DUF1000-domain-containing protein [Hysterangium stoloniferum]
MSKVSLEFFCPEFDNLLQAKKDGLVVVDFYADWCGNTSIGPCHAISPFYTSLSNKYRHVTFSKVDVDQCQLIAQRYEVSAMPTFLFIRNKAVVGNIKGANPNELEAMVVKHDPSTSTASASGSGSKTEPAPGDVSLLEFLDSSQLNCLNENNSYTVKSILGTKALNTSKSYLLSDADEQLLINITFNQTVRVRSIILHTSTVSQGPKKIKLLTNKPALGFEDVEDQIEPEVAQVLELNEDTVKEGRHIPLRYVRFQTVNSLHIFVASNQGGEDETRIDAIDIFGVPVEITKSLSGLKKQEE